MTTNRLSACVHVSVKELAAKCTLLPPRWLNYKLNYKPAHASTGKHPNTLKIVLQSSTVAKVVSKLLSKSIMTIKKQWNSEFLPFAAQDQRDKLYLIKIN